MKWGGTKRAAVYGRTSNSRNADRSNSALEVKEKKCPTRPVVVGRSDVWCRLQSHDVESGVAGDAFATRRSK